MNTPSASGSPVITDSVSAADSLSHEEFCRLWEENKSKVFALALKILGNIHDAEEVCQQVALQLFTKGGTFRGEAQWSTWLHAVARNESLHFRQVRDKRLHIDIAAHEELSDSSALPAEIVLICMERCQIFHQVVGELPEAYGRIFALSEFDGRSNKEIADLLGINICAVKSRLHRARRMVEKRVEACLAV